MFACVHALGFIANLVINRASKKHFLCAGIDDENLSGSLDTPGPSDFLSFIFNDGEVDTKLLGLFSDTRKIVLYVGVKHTESDVLVCVGISDFPVVW